MATAKGQKSCLVALAAISNCDVSSLLGHHNGQGDIGAPALDTIVLRHAWVTFAGARGDLGAAGIGSW